MALNKQDATRFEGLQQMATMLRNNMSLSREDAETQMKQLTADFEADTSHKIKHLEEAVNGEFLEVVDLRKDFLRTRKPNEDNLVLRAKVQSVPVEVKLFKAGAFEIDNASVVAALRSLANEVEALPVELITLGDADVREEAENAEVDAEAADSDAVEAEQADAAEQADYAEQAAEALEAVDDELSDEDEEALIDSLVEPYPAASEPKE